MRVEISEMPSQPFEIFKVGEEAVIRFFENPEEVVKEEAINWAVDEYKLTVPYRKNLASAIESNLSVWMDAAKAQETVVPKKTVEERVSTVEEVVTTLAEVVLL